MEKKALNEISNAIKTLAYHVSSKEDRDAVLGHLDRLESILFKKPDWTQLNDIKELRRGDLVRAKGGIGNTFIVDSNYGGRATGVCVADITNPCEWEKLTQ